MIKQLSTIMIRSLSWLYIATIGSYAIYRYFLWFVTPYTVSDAPSPYETHFFPGIEIIIFMFISGVVLIVQLPGWHVLHKYDINSNKNLPERITHFIPLQKMTWGYIVFCAALMSVKYLFFMLLEYSPTYIQHDGYALHYLVEWYVIFIGSLCPGLLVLWHVYAKKRGGYEEKKGPPTWLQWGNSVAILYSVILTILMFLHVFIRLGDEYYSITATEDEDFIEGVIQVIGLKHIFIFLMLQFPAWFFLWKNNQRRFFYKKHSRGKRKE